MEGLLHSKHVTCVADLPFNFAILARAHYTVREPLYISPAAYRTREGLNGHVYVPPYWRFFRGRKSCCPGPHYHEHRESRRSHSRLFRQRLVSCPNEGRRVFVQRLGLIIVQEHSLSGLCTVKTGLAVCGKTGGGLFLRSSSICVRMLGTVRSRLDNMWQFANIVSRVMLFAANFLVARGEPWSVNVNFKLKWLRQLA